MAENLNRIELCRRNLKDGQSFLLRHGSSGMMEVLSNLDDQLIGKDGQLPISFYKASITGHVKKKKTI